MPAESVPLGYVVALAMRPGDHVVYGGEAKKITRVDGTGKDPPYYTWAGSEGNLYNWQLCGEPADPRHALARELGRLVGILTTIREEQVSLAIGFGKDEADKKQHAAIYAAEINRQANKIDVALESASHTLTRLKIDELLGLVM